MLKKGFTLAELLICLTILGVIATFTIPKVLQSQQNSKYTAMTKEVMGMVSGAFSAYQNANTVTATMHMSDLTPYINYVSVQTTGSIDTKYGATGSTSCSTLVPCLRMHNGGVMAYYSGTGTGTNGNYFGGTAGNYYIYYFFDPDGTLTSSAQATGPGKRATMILYANGRNTFQADCVSSDYTYEDGAQQLDCPGDPIPDWLSW